MDLSALGVEIRELAYDTRTVVPGTLFFCIPGSKVDGHELAEEAVAKGAVALVVERRLELDVPQLVVPSVRAAMGPAAADFFGEPFRVLKNRGIQDRRSISRSPLPTIVRTCKPAWGFPDTPSYGRICIHGRYAWPWGSPIS